MVLRILLPLILLLLLPAWGIDRMSLRRRLKKPWRQAFYAPNVLLILLLAATSINESYSAAADHWKGLLLSLVILVVVPETLLALLLGFSRLVGRWLPRWRRPLAVCAWGVAVLGFGAMLYGLTLGYRHIVVKHYAYVNPAIPAAFDGYRIVQLSDLHLGTLHGRPEVVERIVDSVNAVRPDLIVFTGDLVNYHADEVNEFEPILRRLTARDGVIAIMGNHDYAKYFRWHSPADSVADIRRLQDSERAMGWQLLLNDHRVLRRGADSIAIVGVENDGRPPFPALADLPRAQRGLADGCFRILLSHDPSHWRRSVIPDTDIPLTLSGHTHGMQFKVGNFSPAAWFYPEWGGPYTEGGQTLYVSLGTGEVLIPFRLGAWPEINVIQLKRQP